MGRTQSGKETLFFRENTLKLCDAPLHLEVRDMSQDMCIALDLDDEEEVQEWIEDDEEEET